ncbi:MAG: hypothetical protein V3S55_15945, partial [Nitrospiraceae bacterium]
MPHFGFISRTDFLRRVGQPNDQSEILLDIREGVGPLFIAAQVFVIVGEAETVIAPVSGARILTTLLEFGSFSFRAGDQIERTVDSVDTTGLTALTISDHGYFSPNGPLSISTDGVLPAGLDATTLYFISSVDADNIRFHTTFDSAEL